MILVRLLLFLALAIMGVSLLLFLVTRDRRYLRFLRQVAVYTLILLAVVLVGVAADRLLAPPMARR